MKYCFAYQDLILVSNLTYASSLNFFGVPIWQLRKFSKNLTVIFFATRKYRYTKFYLFSSNQALGLTIPTVRKCTNNVFAFLGHIDKYKPVFEEQLLGACDFWTFCTCIIRSWLFRGTAFRSTFDLYLLSERDQRCD